MRGGGIEAAGRRNGGKAETAKADMRKTYVSITSELI